MKLSFEAVTIEDIFEQMAGALDTAGWYTRQQAKLEKLAKQAEDAAVSEEAPKSKIGKSSLPKPKKAKPAKQAEPEPEGEDETSEPPEDDDEAPTVSPADLARIRDETITALQQAYAKGKQKEVHDLLVKHGNGAQSFRELSAEAFIPIRKELDAGVLG